MTVPLPRIVIATFALAAMGVAAAPRVHAAQVSGLYEGQVPVSGKQADERVAALGAALRQVLSKLTGLAQPSGPVLEVAVAEPERLVQQFRYLDTPGAEVALALWARFDQGFVDALLANAALPRWGGQRPGLLAWVEVVGAEGPELVAADGGAGLAAALSRRAWERGLALTFPLLDLDDRVRVSAGGLWALSAEDVVSVSARYDPGATLVGRVESTGAGAWEARWRLYEAGATHVFESRGLTPAATAASALDAVADALAARYVVSGAAGEGAALAVEVVGVRNLDDYARALEYLGGLDAIEVLRLSGASGERLAFRMQVRGGADGLRRIASFGGVLVEEPAAQDGALRFRLLP